MKASSLQVNGVYKHKSTDLGFAQVLQVLPPKTGENTSTQTLVKCAWSIEPTFEMFAFCKYFKPADLTPYTSGVPVTQPVQTKETK